ncbi:hypothetical protein EV581_102672 [Bacillus sp. BK006]|nr:hypothetical protein EV581_102672 [Bacillus sp. BK006]
MEPLYIVLSIFLAAMLSYDIAKFVRGDRPDWKEGLVTGLVFVGFLAEQPCKWLFTLYSDERGWDKRSLVEGRSER